MEYRKTKAKVLSLVVCGHNVFPARQATAGNTPACVNEIVLRWFCKLTHFKQLLVEVRFISRRILFCRVAPGCFSL